MEGAGDLTRGWKFGEMFIWPAEYLAQGNTRCSLYREEREAIAVSSFSSFIFGSFPLGLMLRCVRRMALAADRRQTMVKAVELLQ